MQRRSIGFHGYVAVISFVLLMTTGEFQGPALLVIFEGANLSREEVTSLQFLPPWRLRGDTLSYGLALLSCFSICDLLSVISGGYYYLFDPRGLVLAPPSSHSPAAKVFSLSGSFSLTLSSLFISPYTYVSFVMLLNIRFRLVVLRMCILVRMLIMFSPLSHNKCGLRSKGFYFLSLSQK